MSGPVGIVGVRFLNARPLLAGLEAGIAAPFAYDFATAEPSVCAERLGSGSVVTGLVPVATPPAMPAVRALPTLGVACRQEATSVLLVSRVAPEKIRTLAVHTASRTSVALARLLRQRKRPLSRSSLRKRVPTRSMLSRKCVRSLTWGSRKPRIW